MFKFKGKDMEFEIRVIDEGIFRFRMAKNGEFTESLLSRYHILTETGDLEAEHAENDETFTVISDDVSLIVNKNTNSLTLTGTKEPVTFDFDGFDGKEYTKKGFTVTASLTEDERLFGLGDESRQNIARRGTFSRLDIRNIASYGPIPYIMSTNGYGLLLNCTYANTFDIGKEDPDKMIVAAHKGNIDFYLFVPKSHKLTDILELHSRVVGKPLMMPKSFYGYTFVLNEQTNAREMLWDCLMFRREDIPCDMVGLEPQWMSHHYDRSVDKKFDEDRFYIPGWLPENQSGPETFFYNLRQMGFKLSLWLCQDYDLLWEEERQAGEYAKKFNKEYSYEGASILDEHFACPNYMDGLTKRDEAWFEHLKKFVDNGASAFKLDGAFQVNDHPDRLWGGKYFDDEVHNVYPVLYVKQMMEGFRDHTDGRRAIIYTPCMYAGSQKYCASWAGDTGGGFDTVVAMLNYGLSGHANVTADMEATTVEGLHYAFFMPWVQQLGWRNWQQPWFLGDELENMIRYYGKLRSSLFPYIYSMAHKASVTAMPIARSISLMFDGHPEYDLVANSYMFGDSFLVGVFDMNITLPEGKWYDFFTGDIYEGGRVIEYKVPEGRGGALFVKCGSIVATMEPVPYVEKAKGDKYTLNLYHGNDCEFTLYEDDGSTYDYLNGEYATTEMTISNSAENSFEFTVKMRNGSYNGREKRPEETYKLSDPVINGMGEVSSFTVVLHTAEAKGVTLNGENVEFTVKDGKTFFEISKEQHKASDLTYTVTF